MRSCPHCGSKLDNPDIQCSNCGRLTPEKNEYADLKNRRKVLKRSNLSRRKTPVKRYILLIAVILFLVLPQTATQRDRIKEYPDDPGKVWDDMRNLWDWMNPKYYKVAATANYKLERKLIISSSEGSSDFSLQIPIPRNFTTADGTRIQTVRDWFFTATKAVNFEKSDPWMFFNGTVQDSETVTITITYEITSKTYEWDELSSSNSGTIAQIPQNLKDKYNHDESMIRGDVDRPLINLDDVRGEAENVTAGKTTVYSKVKAIYKFIVENVVYQVGSLPKTCRETLHGKVGDCDDMVLLFTAMCRSIGIPAFPGYGFVSNQKFVGWGGHSWANVVMPDKDGDVFIPQIDLPNTKFLWYDPYRLIEWNADGNEENLSDYYYVFHSKGSGTANFSPEFHLKTYSTEGEKLIKAD